MEECNETCDITHESVLFGSEVSCHEDTDQQTAEQGDDLAEDCPCQVTDDLFLGVREVEAVEYAVEKRHLFSLVFRVEC